MGDALSKNVQEWHISIMVRVFSLDATILIGFKGTSWPGF